MKKVFKNILNKVKKRTKACPILKNRIILDGFLMLVLVVVTFSAGFYTAGVLREREIKEVEREKVETIKRQVEEIKTIKEERGIVGTFTEEEVQKQSSELEELRNKKNAE